MSELIDNKAHRIRTLKEIIRHLHAGEAPDEVRAQLKQIVKECDASEIAAMEQELIKEGVPVQELMSMCDLHAQVVRDILVDRQPTEAPPGHPAETFRRENAALQETIASFRAALESTVDAAGQSQEIDTTSVNRCRQLFNDLMDIDKHYQRKEHLLFSCLERHGITGPSKVMWGKDDEIRELLQQLGASLDQESLTVAQITGSVARSAEQALAAVEDMIYKEENILLPMALQTLTDTEWGEIWRQSPEFGWCLIEPAEEYRAPEAEVPDVPAAVTDEAQRAGVALSIVPSPDGASRPPSGSLIFPTGCMTLDQLTAIFKTLPVDITFVDADDRVRFFNEGADRVFVRPRAVIGRKVQHCHPPGSLDVVNRIVGDFRAGRQNVAEFWITLQGRFVHIRYFAVHDEAGQYAGTLEVTQDVTGVRALEGERRLLQYG